MSKCALTCGQGSEFVELDFLPLLVFLENDWVFSFLGDFDVKKLWLNGSSGVGSRRPLVTVDGVFVLLCSKVPQVWSPSQFYDSVGFIQSRIGVK